MFLFQLELCNNWWHSLATQDSRLTLYSFFPSDVSVKSFISLAVLLTRGMLAIVEYVQLRVGATQRQTKKEAVVCCQRTLSIYEAGIIWRCEELFFPTTAPRNRKGVRGKGWKSGKGWILCATTDRHDVGRNYTGKIIGKLPKLYGTKTWHQLYSS